MIGELIWIILIGGTAIYGRTFPSYLYSLIVNGVPNTMNREQATTTYNLLERVLITAIILATIGMALGVAVGHWYLVFGRIWIYWCILVPLAIFFAFFLLARTITTVLVTLVPARDIDTIHRSVKDYLMWAMLWQIFIGLVLIIIGPYAPVWAFGLALLGAALYAGTAYVTGKPIVWTPRVFKGTALAVIALTIIAALPLSFWSMFGMTKRPITFMAAHSLEQHRFEQLEAQKDKEICQQQIEVHANLMRDFKIPTYNPRDIKSIERYNTQIGYYESLKQRRAELVVECP